MLPLAQWWLVALAFSLIGFPFTFYLFHRLPDRGYAFGRALTLLFLSYTLWLLGLAHLLPNTRSTIIILLLALAGLSLFLGWRRRQEIRAFFSREWPFLLITEVLFGAAFYLWAIVRAYNPDITYGEKPMDFAFFNSSWRSPYFPPSDPWLSGHTISYYYFGYVMMSAVARLGGTPPEVGYNLAQALLFAMVAVGVFSLVANLVRLRRPGLGQATGFGLVGVGFFIILGNLEGFLEFLHSHNFGSPGFWQYLGIKDLGSPYHSDHWYPTDHWWWWRATRLIDTLRGGQSLDYTITEFPFFSFIFGDLHPHLMALPFNLLALGLTFNVFLTTEKIGLAWLRRRPLVGLALLISLGALGFLNTWDLPTYLAIFVSAFLLQTYFCRGRAGEAILLSLVVAVGSVLLFLPYYLGQRLQVQGIWPWFGPGTRPLHYFLFWGLFLFLATSFLITRAGWWREWRRGDGWMVLLAAIIVLYPFVLWLVARLSLTYLSPVPVEGLPSPAGRLESLAPLMVASALALGLLLRRRSGEDWQRGEASHLFALLLFFWGLFLTMGVELFYVRDLFGTRMNTMFKLYYQAWAFLAIASAYGLYHILSIWRPVALWNQVLRGLWWSLLLLLILAAAAYPLAATFSFSNGFHRSPTLDGLAFIDRGEPGERQAIIWLRGQRGTPVIVEAIGADTNIYGRVSSRTGLPTILGEAGHEAQWRGYRPLGDRTAEVDAIYLSRDKVEVGALLKKYQVRFVYVGLLEEITYGPQVFRRFEGFLERAYENEQVFIYHVPGQ